MQWPSVALLIGLSVTTGLWGFLLVKTMGIGRGTRIVYPVRGKRLSSAPFVSVLLAVRNEADRVLGRSVTSLLAQDYVEYEVIAVDDCSTDVSLDLLQAIGTQDQRLRVISGKEPPSGWIGKTWALEQAKREAKGEWLLAADADVIYSPFAISAGVHVAMTEGCDAVTLLPRVDLIGIWERIVFPSMAWASLLRVPPAVASDPRSRRCFGMGNFILMRRSLHDEVGGYSKYSAEVLEDCWTMQLIKDAGGAVLAGDGRNLFRTRMYRALGEIVDGFSKNAFAAANYSVLTTLAVLSVYIVLLALPFGGIGWYWVRSEASLCLSCFLDTITLVLSLVSVALTVGTDLVFRKRCKWPLRHASLCWIGHVLGAFVLARSMLLSLGSGVRWKDRAVRRPANSPGRI